MYAILAAEDLPKNHTLLALYVPALRVTHVFCVAGSRRWPQDAWFRVSIDSVSSWETFKAAEVAITQFNARRKA